MPRRRRKRKVVRVNSRRPINIDKLFFGCSGRLYVCDLLHGSDISAYCLGYEVQAWEHWQSTIPIKDLLFGRRRSVQQILPVM